MLDKIRKILEDVEGDYPPFVMKILQEVYDNDNTLSEYETTITGLNEKIANLETEISELKSANAELLLSQTDNEPKNEPKNEPEDEIKSIEEILKEGIE